MRRLLLFLLIPAAILASPVSVTLDFPDYTISVLGGVDVTGVIENNSPDTIEFVGASGTPIQLASLWNIGGNFDGSNILSSGQVFRGTILTLTLPPNFNPETFMATITLNWATVPLGDPVTTAYTSTASFGVTILPTPEPETWFLLAGGLLLCRGLLTRRMA